MDMDTNLIKEFGLDLIEPKVALEQIKVVILGQDPYHLPNVADGIAFSTQKEKYIPASLRNIFRELSSDLNCVPPSKVFWGQKALKIGEQVGINANDNFILFSTHPSPYSAESKTQNRIALEQANLDLENKITKKNNEIFELQKSNKGLVKEKEDWKREAHSA
ncbi:6706_t:CDS:2, partial [Funneliformis geosporum]